MVRSQHRESVREISKVGRIAQANLIESATPVWQVHLDTERSDPGRMVPTRGPSRQPVMLFRMGARVLLSRMDGRVVGLGTDLRAGGKMCAHFGAFFGGREAVAGGIAVPAGVYIKIGTQKRAWLRSSDHRCFAP